MNKLKKSLLFLTLSSVLACIPAHTQENERDYKAELQLELDAMKKKVCEQTYLAPRTFYRIRSTSESRLSDEEVQASIKRVKELTELHNNLYRAACGSSN